MTKQFYISITIGDLEDTAVMGTDKSAQYIKSFVLNTSLLSESELELFIGTLAVQGLLSYYRCSLTDHGCIYIKYDDIV